MSADKPETFKDLFIANLRTTYDVEQQLISALPKMAEAANDPELKKGFQNHFQETQGHVKRIEEIFRSLALDPTTEKSETVRGLIADAEWCIEKIQDPNVLDSALISAGQSAEHYEMAMYGSASAWAKVMGLTDVARVLEQTLSEEKKADQTLNEAAIKLNKLAYDESKDTDEEESKGILGMGKMQTGNI